MAVISRLDPDFYPLTRLSPEIMKRYGEAPSYAMLYHRACSGRLPQIHYSGNRLYFRMEDVAAIARTFGLTDEIAPPADTRATADTEAA
jgi:hypothetical protein